MKSDQPLFAALREMFGPLSQSQVDRINAALAEGDGAPFTPPSTGRTVGKEGLELIKTFEGYKKELPGDLVQAYPDPATGGAPWTIGWGTTGPDVRPGTIWTKAQAEQRFEAHVKEFAEKVEKMLGGAPTTRNEFDALVSLCYNIGPANLASSTLLRKHKARDYAGAAAEFARWNKANKKVMAGLTRRRAAEAALYVK